LNKGDVTKTKLPIFRFLFTLLIVETYNLTSKLPTKMHQVHYPAPRTPFSGTITSCRKARVVLKLRKIIFEISSLQQRKLVVWPTWWLGYSLWRFL